MSITKQLYQLQELELQIEAKEKAVQRMTAELGESQALLRARITLAERRKRLEDLLTEQRSLEWEIEDITGKVNGFEKDLYSGRIKIPKELTSLQQEVGALKAKRTVLEDKALVVMEEADKTRQEVSRLVADLDTVENECRSQQDALKTQIDSEKRSLVDLTGKQQALAREIDGPTLQLYRTLRQQKGSAVARVEQGICRGCRISLPVQELQSVRSGTLVQCSSCGRILYLP
jgi:predicted  nucleic acid-binding Zn-ribbon protein